MNEIIKSNGLIIGLYVFCLVLLAYLFRDSIELVQFIFIIQSILFLLALTPIFEKLMRILNHAYKPNMQELENIESIFNEVYIETKKEKTEISSKVELLINNDIEPNAFALGTNTIVVTKGAVDFFDENELRGIIAHEFGHLAHWDTKILLLIMSSNLVFMFLALLIRVICFIIRFLTGSENDYKMKLLGFIKNILMIVISFFIHAFISLSRRKSESMADEFAYKLGYGNGLISALYKIQILETGQELSLKEKIMSDHPETQRRIKYLEQIC